jgi:hypothetical protein
MNEPLHALIVDDEPPLAARWRLLASDIRGERRGVERAGSALDP